VQRNNRRDILDYAQHRSTGIIHPPMEEDVKSQCSRGITVQSNFSRDSGVPLTGPDTADLKEVSGIATDSELTENNSDCDEDSSDAIDGYDYNWTGSADFVEAAIYQAAFPDQELAAHLISKMHGELLLGSSKKVSRKVSSWRAKITSCPTDSGTTSTEKAGTAKLNSSTPSSAGSKRGRMSGSADSPFGEDEEDDIDDNDENRRKRAKEDDIDGGLIATTQKLACPFNKMDPIKYSNLSGLQYRTCTGPGYATIQLLR